MSPEPPLLSLLSVVSIPQVFQSFSWDTLFLGLSIVILLGISATISGSEVAFFSISRENQFLSEHPKIKALLKAPQELLATILITNNVVNIGIVILVDIFLNALISYESVSLEYQSQINFVINVVLTSSLLLLFGEILPKIYANRNPFSFSVFMSGPMTLLRKLLGFPVKFLTLSTAAIEKKPSNFKIDVEDLSQALEITQEEGEHLKEQEILEGIANFGGTMVTEIMTSRQDISALDIDSTYDEVKTFILDKGHSRIPVYSESLDQIKGVLYIKDVLPHLHHSSGFRWQILIRDAYFVIESMKLDDLLHEFQKQKMHIAIVVDEYGGTSGLVSMEDVLEEIVGDISADLDPSTQPYTKIDDSTYLLEGKMLLKDFFRLVELSEEEVEQFRGDFDTLGGLILETYGNIPRVGTQVEVGRIHFTVQSKQKHRIEHIQCKINE